MVRNVFQQRQRVLGRHVQQVGNGNALVFHRQRLGIIAPPAAHFAGHENVGEEVHFDAPQPLALARFAAPAFDVETEPPGAVAALARFRQHGKQLANGREDPGVGGGIGARRSPDGRLVDDDDLVEVLQAGDGAMGARLLDGAVELLGDRAMQDVVYQRRFSRARYARHHGQQPQAETARRCSSDCWPAPPAR